MMRSRRESGFTLVELLIVVVISGLALIAIYETLITQQRTYQYQSGAIDTQGTTRMGLQVIASELREISASAGDDGNAQGSDLLVASADSIRFRAFRKIGIVCSVDPGSPPGYVDVWVPGQPFEETDSIFVFADGATDTEDDDAWLDPVIESVQSEASDSGCEPAWDNQYDTQSLRFSPSASYGDVLRGGLIRSYKTVTYRPFSYDGQWVLGRREGVDGKLEPLVGPLVAKDGIVFRYYDANGNELTSPSTQAELADVARVFVSVKAISPGAGPGNEPLIDSLSTNVYLRGN